MILLSAPNIAGNEWKYVKDCLDTGWVSSVGAYVTQFENMVAQFAGARYGIAAVNGTAALHISLMLAGVKRGDYVIVPNITFIASVNAISYEGAKPIFMDINPDTWQMDMDLLEKFLQEETDIVRDRCVLKSNKKTVRAIMPVHVLGNMCDMDRLMALSRQYHLEVVEDATEALGSYYEGRHAGSFGKFGCFSFNGNKIITTGGGGVIVTDDEELAKKAKHLTTQAKSHPIEYIHDEIGYNYRLVNLLAAVGVAQMELLPGFIQRKKEIDAFYKKELGGLGDITFQQVADKVDHNCWLFTFKASRQKEILDHLLKNDIQARPFWMPMNRLRMFEKSIYYSNNDRAGHIYSTCLSIPCSTFLTDEVLQIVATSIKELY
jgi:aminotransferase in exopolysaccharide biosynthesis